MQRNAAVTRGRPPPSCSVSSASAGVRVSRSSPFAITYVRSASATVRWARCSTSSTVMPRSRISASASKTTSTTVGRSPSDGSSSSSTSGRATSARAIASCCCWPPESAPAWRRRNSSHDREQLEDGLEVGSSAPSRSRRPASPSRRFSSTVSSAKMRPPLGHERDPAARDVLGRAAAERRSRRAGSSPPRGGDEPHDRVQRRRLAGAVRADQPDDLAPPDLEREAADGRDAAVARRRGRRARASGRSRARSSRTALSPR